MNLPAKADGSLSTSNHSSTRKDVKSTVLCSKCSPLFGGDGALQDGTHLVMRTIEDIRAHAECACCRMLKFLLSDATAISKVKMIHRFQALVVYNDGGDARNIGSITRSTESRCAHMLRFDPLIAHRHTNIHPKTGTLNYEEIRNSLQRCKGEHCLDVSQERERYRTSINANLIDVEQMCLVMATTRQRYVALSYVCKPPHIMFCLRFC